MFFLLGTQKKRKVPDKKNKRTYMKEEKKNLKLVN
jgi:hypothetical protein